MSEISELTKALQETTKELKAQRESIESLKKVFSELGTGYYSAVPVDSGLTGNQIRQLYNLKKIEEKWADKVIISSRLYNMLIQADLSPERLMDEENERSEDKC